MHQTVITTKKGRIFVSADKVAYVRLDGNKTYIKTWQSVCEVCGKPFYVITPKGVKELGGSKSFDLVTCKEHRLSQEEISRRGVAARAQSMNSKHKK